MTQTEVTKVLAVLWAAYPTAYAKISDTDRRMMVALWTKLFEADPMELVEAAVLSLIRTRRETYPPAPGEVAARMEDIASEEYPSEGEAWAMVMTAVRRGIHDSAAGFASLPPIVRQAVGSPAMIRQWATMDEKTVGSVVASNFCKAYATVCRRSRSQKAIPPSLRGVLPQLRAPDAPEET